MKAEIDKISFFLRFTESEMVAYFQGISANTFAVLLVREIMLLAPYVMEIDHPAMVQSLHLLASAGVIAPARIQEILAP